MYQKQNQGVLLINIAQHHSSNYTLPASRICHKADSIVIGRQILESHFVVKSVTTYFIPTKMFDRCAPSKEFTSIALIKVH